MRACPAGEDHGILGVDAGGNEGEAPRGERRGPHSFAVPGEFCGAIRVHEERLVAAVEIQFRRRTHGVPWIAILRGPKSFTVRGTSDPAIRWRKARRGWRSRPGCRRESSKQSRAGEIACGRGGLPGDSRTSRYWIGRLPVTLGTDVPESGGCGSRGWVRWVRWVRVLGGATGWPLKIWTNRGTVGARERSNSRSETRPIPVWSIAQVVVFQPDGARERNRTSDQGLMSPLLYR